MSGCYFCLIISLIPCFVLNVINGMTLGVAYSRLEQRIENLEMDTFYGMKKLNDRMNSIETFIKSQMDAQTLSNKGSFVVSGNTRIVENKRIRKCVQKELLKAVVSGKHEIHDASEKCMEQFNDFKQIVYEQMRYIHQSLETLQYEQFVTVTRLNDSLKQYQLDTDVKLQEITADFQTALDNTGVIIEVSTSEHDSMQTIIREMEDFVKILDTAIKANSKTSGPGGKQVLDCHLNYPDGKPVTYMVEWKKQGLRESVLVMYEGYPPNIPPQFEGRVRLVDGVSLEISNIREEDEGWYGCEVTYLNGVGNGEYRSNVTWKRLEVHDKWVGFTARLTKKLSRHAKDTIIVFDELESSYGGGYSTSTGKFTAPKSGLYLFQFNVQAYGSQKVHAALYVDGQLKASAIVQKGPNMTGSNTAVAYMHRGDIAYVKTAENDPTYGIWPYRTSFTGVLIH